MSKFIDRTGEVNVNKQGLKMTIIRYRRAGDIDVQFENGEIVRNKTYDAFIKKGIRLSQDKLILGETNVATNGMQMTIIACRSLKDIDIQFEDSTIVKHKVYRNFKAGYITNPNLSTSAYKRNKRLGEVGTARNGMPIKIIKYKNANDIDIQFEDGTVSKHKMYKSFKQGNIGHPSVNLHVKNRVGETSIAFNGMQMKIVSYKGVNDVDIQFEDGTIVTNKRYDSFKSGTVKNPNYKVAEEKSRGKIGEIYRAVNGLQIQIIKYNTVFNVDIVFNDGTVVKCKRYRDIKSGSVGHPKYSKCKKLFACNNEDFYECTCKKCKGKHILKLSEMKDFECK